MGWGRWSGLIGRTSWQAAKIEIFKSDQRWRGSLVERETCCTVWLTYKLCKFMHSSNSSQNSLQRKNSFIIEISLFLSFSSHQILLSFSNLLFSSPLLSSLNNFLPFFHSFFFFMDYSKNFWQKSFYELFNEYCKTLIELINWILINNLLVAKKHLLCSYVQ